MSRLGLLTVTILRAPSLWWQHLSFSSTPSWLRYFHCPWDAVLQKYATKIHKPNLWFLQQTVSCEALPQPSSSNAQPEQARPGQDCSDYHTSSVLSAAMPYDPQTYSDPPAPIAFTSSMEQPSSSSVPLLYPVLRQRFGYYATTSVNSTVITHTASTAGAPGSALQAHGYAHTRDTYPQTPGHSLSYPAAVADPGHPSMPSVTAAHCFSVPEQVAVTGVRGKHKQKTGGVRIIGPSVASSGPLSTDPTPSSCLAKLLSSSTCERESVLSIALVSVCC